MGKAKFYSFCTLGMSVNTCEKYILCSAANNAHTHTKAWAFISPCIIAMKLVLIESQKLIAKHYKNVSKSLQKKTKKKKDKI